MSKNFGIKAITELNLSKYPDFCIWDGSIVRTKMLSIIWELSKNNEINILDIGCGTAQMWSQFLKNMPNVSLYGFDTGDKSILVAKKNLEGLKANISKGSITSLSKMFSEIKKFDFIVSHSVLEHVVPRHLFFSSISQRLTENGHGLISWGSDHFRQGTKTDIRNYVSRLLAKVKIESYYTAEVDEIWARKEIENAGLKIHQLHYYSLVELKKLLKFASKNTKQKIFQNWIKIEEEFNKDNENNTNFRDKLDETFLILSKNNY